MLTIFPPPPKPKSAELGDTRDKLIRRAFGRYRKRDALAEGKKITNEYLTAKRWIACDCQGSIDRPPMLYPHGRNGIQREPKGRGPEHDEFCVFAKYPVEQSVIVKSYKRQTPTDRPRRMVPSFGGREPNDRPAALQSTTARTRPGLAKLLIELLESARTPLMLEGALMEQPDRLESQIEDIKTYSHSVWLDRGQPLSRWLATSFTEYLDLRRRLDEQDTDWYHGRPHGFYIDTFARIEDQTLYKHEKRQKPFITVDGRLYTYGGYEPARSPYLAICLVAKPQPNRKPRVMRAYAHPCLNSTNWALVDSAIEKDTLREILGCKRYLGQRDIELTVLKPLSDVGPQSVTERPVCIPDFVVTATGSDCLAPTVVVETIGIKSASYDSRKELMKEWHEQVFSTKEYPKTPIVRHERAGITSDSAIAASDDKFWQRLRKQFSNAKGRTGNWS